MPTRYTANYDHSQETRFRCSVELGPLGWSARIFDLAQQDVRTKKPLEAFWQCVNDPLDGKALLEQILPRFLNRNGFPQAPLNWNESD